MQNLREDGQVRPIWQHYFAAPFLTSTCCLYQRPDTFPGNGHSKNHATLLSQWQGVILDDRKQFD